MIRNRPLRPKTLLPEKDRCRGAGFVWVAGFALAAYLGTAA